MYIKKRQLLYFKAVVIFSFITPSFDDDVTFLYCAPKFFNAIYFFEKLNLGAFTMQSNFKRYSKVFFNYNYNIIENSIHPPLAMQLRYTIYLLC